MAPSCLLAEFLFRGGCVAALRFCRVPPWLKGRKYCCRLALGLFSFRLRLCRVGVARTRPDNRTPKMHPERKRFVARSAWSTKSARPACITRCVRVHRTTAQAAGMSCTRCRASCSSGNHNGVLAAPCPVHSTCRLFSSKNKRSLPEATSTLDLHRIVTKI